MNAQHDGQVLSQSSDPQEQYVYQRLVNNLNDSSLATDIRTYVVNNSLILTMYRHHPKNDRFDSVIKTEWVDTDTVFSKEEQDLIIHFCKAIGLEFGEMDIVRDRDDGKMYIIDVGNAPGIPHPREMTKEDCVQFLHTLCISFTVAFLPSESK